MQGQIGKWRRAGRLGTLAALDVSQSLKLGSGGNLGGNRNLRVASTGNVQRGL